MADAVISYTDEDSDLVFQWHGGPYIDVGTFADFHEINGDGARFHAFDVINVWDDVEDMSAMEVETRDHAESYRRPFRTILETFEALCQQYVRDAGEVEA